MKRTKSEESRKKMHEEEEEKKRVNVKEERPRRAKEGKKAYFQGLWNMLLT